MSRGMILSALSAHLNLGLAFLLASKIRPQMYVPNVLIVPIIDMIKAVLSPTGLMSRSQSSISKFKTMRVMTCNQEKDSLYIRLEIITTMTMTLTSMIRITKTIIMRIMTVYGINLLSAAGASKQGVLIFPSASQRLQLLSRIEADSLCSTGQSAIATQVNLFSTESISSATVVRSTASFRTQYTTDLKGNRADLTKGS